MDQINLNISSSLFAVLHISDNVTVILTGFDSDTDTARKEIGEAFSTSPVISSSSESAFHFDVLQDMISFILNGYLTTFCVVTGTLLNLLCIIIFLHCRHGSIPIIQYYLIALTIWQTSLLCNAFLLYSLPTLIYGRLISTGRYVYLYPYAYALANTTHTGSVWIVLALTIDRYLALCRPLTHRAIGKRSRVKRLMIAVSLMAIIFSLPRFFEVHAVCLYIEEENDTSCLPTVARTELTQNHTYWQIYHIILAMIFVTVAPCLLLFALTVRISLAIRKAYVRRKSLCASKTDSSSKQKEISTRKEHKANIMLVLVIAKFLISDILPTVADVLEHLVGGEAFMNSSIATLFVDVSNFLLVLNCSTNFWVFIIYGRRFRQSFVRLMGTTSIGLRLRQLFRLEEKEDAGPTTLTVVMGATSSTKRASSNTSISGKQLYRVTMNNAAPSLPLLATNGFSLMLRDGQSKPMQRRRRYSSLQPQATFRPRLTSMFPGRARMNGSISKVLSFKDDLKPDI